MNIVQVGVSITRFILNVRKHLKAWGWHCSYPLVKQDGGYLNCKLVVSGSSKQRIYLRYNSETEIVSLVVVNGNSKYETDGVGETMDEQLSGLLPFIEDIPFMLF